VELEQVAPCKGRARWTEGGLPRSLEYDTADPDTLPAPPPLPGSGQEMPPSFLAALAEAARTASRDSVRASLAGVLLRGGDGAVIGTDGRQLLLHKGFSFPWQDGVLLPALPAFASKELLRQDPLRLERSEGRITLRVGPWLLVLKAEVSLRYPNVDQVIPRV